MDIDVTKGLAAADQARAEADDAVASAVHKVRETLASGKDRTEMWGLLVMDFNGGPFPPPCQACYLLASAVLALADQGGPAPMRMAVCLTRRQRWMFRLTLLISAFVPNPIQKLERSLHKILTSTAPEIALACDHPEEGGNEDGLDSASA